MIKKLVTLTLLLVILANTGFSQIKPDDDPLGRDGMNVITTAVPFLLIAPESRSGAMGESGVATTPDANSMHWNPAKYGFVEKDLGLSLSYTPWLRALIPDMSISYLAGYKRIDKRQVVGASLRFFSLGSITFTTTNGQPLNEYSPHEFALDGSYSLLLSKYISGAVALRFIYSNLTGGAYIDGVESHAGKAVAGDVAFYFNKPLTIKDKSAKLAIGMNISNLGTKISYTDEVQNFLPTNLRLGSSFTLDIDDYNSFTFTTDFNKLLVPTPPVYNDSSEIIAGKDPNVSVPTGLFQSFGDAPNGFKEEMQEVSFCIGTEYWYSKKFAIRGGYFLEHDNKGGRKFLTLGLGLRLNVFSLDFSYLMPTSQRNPLENTLRFTLGLNFEALQKESDNDKKTTP